MNFEHIKYNELVFDEYYYIIRTVVWPFSKDKIEGYFASYSGILGFNNPLLRFINIHKGSKKYKLNLFSSDNTTFYKIPSNIPMEVFIGNILPFI